MADFDLTPGEGWIKVYRKIKTSWIWNSPEPYDFRSAWLDLILSANYTERTLYIDGQLVQVERGTRSQRFFGQ